MSASWIIDALLASTLLMAAVLLVRAPVRRAFGPQLAYMLWALPALRLLLPPLPAGWWRAEAAAPITRAGETVTVYLVEPIATAAARPSVALVAAIVWGLGVLSFLAWHLARHHRFCRAVLRNAEAVEVRDKVVVIASAAAPGPLAFGIVRRYVAFPADFATRYDADEQSLALQHELGHHRRRDLLANWAALAVLALHWFNPLAWAAFRAFRADQELANDAGVLAGCPADKRHAYGRAIVKAASPHAALAIGAACHLHTITDLKGRLRMLTTSRTSRRRLVAGSAAVAVIVSGGLGLTASSSAAERVAATLDAPLPTVAPVAFTPAQMVPAPPSGPAHVSATQRKHVVVVTKDGATRTYEGAEADRYVAEHHLPLPPVPSVPPVGAAATAPPVPRVMVMRRLDREGPNVAWTTDIPQVSSGNCAGDSDRPMVENRTEGGRRVVIVCTNRIEAMQRDAQVGAVRAEAMARGAVGSARINLRMARGAIERDRSLSAEQRAQALAGIAQAEAELRDPAND